MECAVGVWDLLWGATLIQGLVSGMGGALASGNWTPAGAVWLLDSVGAGPSGCWTFCHWAIWVLGTLGAGSSRSCALCVPGQLRLWLVLEQEPWQEHGQ